MLFLSLKIKFEMCNLNMKVLSSAGDLPVSECVSLPVYECVSLTMSECILARASVCVPDCV